MARALRGKGHLFDHAEQPPLTEIPCLEIDLPPPSIKAIASPRRQLRHLVQLPAPITATVPRVTQRKSCGSQNPPVSRRLVGDRFHAGEVDEHEGENRVDGQDDHLTAVREQEDQRAVFRRATSCCSKKLLLMAV